MVSGPPRELEAINHIGITVTDLDRSLAFWQSFLGVEPALAKDTRRSLPGRRDGLRGHRDRGEHA